MSDTVTIVVRQRVKQGREAEYEAWLKRMTEGASANFPGYIGVGFHRPANPGDTYRQIFRFDSVEQLEEFERSDYRAAMLAEGAHLFEADPTFERMTGLEFWFDPPKGTKVPQPSPHRMALVMIVVVFTMILILSSIIGALTPSWPQPLRLLMTVTIQVCLMTYVVMPRLTPLIARFVYPRSRTV
ncbi:MAG: antibiotic biosynthesis monooxygenase [Pseudomonadota bacterium]